MIRRLAPLLFLALPAAAQQPYAGLQQREILGLSESDIAALEAGDGWGLALPAELSGWPGPMHLLEHAEALGLSEETVARIEAMEAEMRAEAKEAGQRLIAAEAALTALFRGGEPSPEKLRFVIEDAAVARAELRYIHLSRHLEVRGLLTEAQVAEYNRIRGYAEDPCARVPEGHDPAMWKAHNNCE